MLCYLAIAIALLYDSASSAFSLWTIRIASSSAAGISFMGATAPDSLLANRIVVVNCTKSTQRWPSTVDRIDRGHSLVRGSSSE